MQVFQVDSYAASHHACSSPCKIVLNASLSGPMTLQRPWCSFPGLLLPLLLVLAALTQHAEAQLRVVSYNTRESANANLMTVLEAIGEEQITPGIAKPIDILLLQEQTSFATTTQTIVDGLNAIYGTAEVPQPYALVAANAATQGAGRPGLVYNTQTVEHLGTKGIIGTSGSGAARQPVRYQLRPIGYGSDADLYAYNSHYKAGDSGSDLSRRLVEATAIRNDADALPQGTHIIYAGDFNMDSSSEAAFQELIASGNGQAFDPPEQLGNWNNNSSFARWHTQSPCTSGCGVGGGVDDRFDFQLNSAELFDPANPDGEGLAYIPGTYQTFGNNGTTYNTSINNGNTITFDSTSFSKTTILNALTFASDHLPVVADYQVPAQMLVTVDPTNRIIRRSSTTDFDVSIVNVANVTAPAGADELDYSVAGSGILSGNVSGTALAASPASIEQLTLDTSAAGSFAAAIAASTSSEAAVNQSPLQNLFIDVLDPSNASFDAVSDLNTLTLDFGQVELGSTVDSLGFDLSNLELASGFTAALDFDSFLGTGDTTALTTNLSPFTNLVAGSSMSFVADIATDTLGDFFANYFLQFSDEDLPGAESSALLTLNITGEVVESLGLDGDFNEDGTVDAADYTTWRAGLGTTFTEADYLIWRANYGQTTGSSATVNAVPEPSAAALFFMACLLGLAKRRQ